MQCSRTHPWRSFAASSIVLVASNLGSSASTTVEAQDGDDRPSVDSTLARIEDKLGNKESRYDRLLKAVTKSVTAILDETHPHVQFVTELCDTALERSDHRRNTKEVVALIKAYPWNRLLELPRDLEAAKDRPVPASTEGFIHLETPEGRLPGYPELHVNHYLWGTGEIAGWQSLMKKGNALFEGRSAKDVIAPAETMPAYEALRVYLAGNLPATPLLAIPELQHRIHSALVAKRTEAAGERQPMDELFALFDSKWNGFEYMPAYSKDSLAFTSPLLSLLVDTHSLPFHFGNSDALKLVGDLPVTAIQTYVEYAKAFHDDSIRLHDFFAKTPEGVAALEGFRRDVAYLGRYQAMIDVLVYSLLSPESPLPKRLALYDYPILLEHMPPAERAAGTTYDVTRRHALLLWAAFGKDPALVANWLQEKILSKERNAFPAAVSLPVVMLGTSRIEEKELLDAVVRRIEAEREALGGSGHGPFERQFSPFKFYLSMDGEPNANALANSYHRFHGELADKISSAALEAINAKVR